MSCIAARSRAFILVQLMSAAWLVPGRSAADDVNAYVSEQFKVLALRAFREIVAAEIAKGCPPDKPLCGIVASRLAEAVDAALRKNDPALRVALEGFFFDSATNGLLQLTLSDALATKELELGKVIGPIVRCLSASLGDKPVRENCGPTAPERELLLQLFAALVVPNESRPKVDAFLVSLRETKKIDPALATRALAAIVAQPPIKRPDIAIYLYRLATLVGQGGFERGLSDAVFKFLTADITMDSSKQDLAVEETVVNYEPGDMPSALFSDQYIDKWMRSAVACGFDTSAISAWKAGRAQDAEALRLAVLRGSAPDFKLLDGLIAYKDDCRDTVAAASILELKRFARYFRSPVASYSAISRYGAGGLAIAAVLDFLRDKDKTRLERNVARVIVYGVARLALQRRLLILLQDEAKSGQRIKQKNLLFIGDGLRSCEVTALAAALGVDVGNPFTSNKEGQCFSFASMALRNGVTPSLRPAGVSIGDWLLQNRGQLAQQFAPLFDKTAFEVQYLGWFDEAHAKELLSASTYLQDGDTAGAAKSVIRIGIDLLMEKLDAATSELTGGPGETVCIEDFNRTSIFQRTGVGCAIHLLIAGAYRPIVDFYWAAGANGSGDSSHLSAAVYRSLLASPAFDHTPLILNVGLGATYVVGNQSVWGKGGYGALTVLDKIGVAFVKTTKVESQFEFGAYVGGFLDALIRTVADSGKQQRYWQMGLTAGWPRVNHLPIGVEFHAAAAMPFELGVGRRYGFAGGASVVVPFTWLFDDKEK